MTHESQIASPADRLIGIGRILLTLRDSFDELKNQNVCTVQERIRESLEPILRILSSSFESDKSSDQKGVWKKNASRLVIIDQWSKDLASDDLPRKLELKLNLIKTGINIWIDRILSSDISQLCGIELRLDKDRLGNERPSSTE